MLRVNSLVHKLMTSGAFMMIMSALLVFPLNAEELISADKAIKKIYKNATNWEVKEIILSPPQMETISEKARVTFGVSHSNKVDIYTVKQNNQKIGYAIEDTVIGKWGPIHYLVGTDLSGKIENVIVLSLYEIRGRPVVKKRFLKQYRKKTWHDPIRLRSDIDGISGATITSRSVTDGIRKVLFILEEFKGSL